MNFSKIEMIHNTFNEYKKSIMDEDTLTAFTIMNFVTMIFMTFFLIHYTAQVKGYNSFLMEYVKRLINIEVDVSKLLIKEMEQSLQDIETGNSNVSMETRHVELETNQSPTLTSIIVKQPSVKKDAVDVEYFV